MSVSENIILTKILFNDNSFTFKEHIPQCLENNNTQALIRYCDGSILWSPIDLSLNLVVNNKFQNTDIYYDNGRVGVGRFPLFSYRVDLAIPKDTRMTALHIGDGSLGFSLGNGTNKGFLPEIIGVGGDKDDAGLYFVGIAGNEKPSDTPLLVFDGRDMYGNKLTNRPIFGVTSGNYNDFILMIDASGNLILNGISILDMINNLQRQIDGLKSQIT
jgi:hypothetical protein